MLVGVVYEQQYQETKEKIEQFRKELFEEFLNPKIQQIVQLDKNTQLEQILIQSSMYMRLLNIASACQGVDNRYLSQFTMYSSAALKQDSQKIFLQDSDLQQMTGKQKIQYVCSLNAKYSSKYLAPPKFTDKDTALCDEVILTILEEILKKDEEAQFFINKVNNQKIDEQIQNLYKLLSIPQESLKQLMIFISKCIIFYQQDAINMKLFFTIANHISIDNKLAVALKVVCSLMNVQILIENFDQKLENKVEKVGNFGYILDFSSKNSTLKIFTKSKTCDQKDNKIKQKQLFTKIPKTIDEKDLKTIQDAIQTARGLTTECTTLAELQYQKIKYFAQNSYLQNPILKQLLDQANNSQSQSTVLYPAIQCIADSTLLGSINSLQLRLRNVLIFTDSCRARLLIQKQNLLASQTILQNALKEREFVKHRIPMLKQVAEEMKAELKEKKNNKPLGVADPTKQIYVTINGKSYEYDDCDCIIKTLLSYDDPWAQDNVLPEKYQVQQIENNEIEAEDISGNAKEGQIQAINNIADDTKGMNKKEKKKFIQHQKELEQKKKEKQIADQKLIEQQRTEQLFKKFMDATQKDRAKLNDMAAKSKVYKQMQIDNMQMLVKDNETFKKNQNSIRDKHNNYKNLNKIKAQININIQKIIFEDQKMFLDKPAKDVKTIDDIQKKNVYDDYEQQQFVNQLEQMKKKSYEQIQIVKEFRTLQQQITTDQLYLVFTQCYEQRLHNFTIPNVFDQQNPRQIIQQYFLKFLRIQLLSNINYNPTIKTAAADMILGVYVNLDKAMAHIKNPELFVTIKKYLDEEWNGNKKDVSQHLEQKDESKSPESLLKSIPNKKIVQDNEALNINATFTQSSKPTQIAKIVINNEVQNDKTDAKQSENPKDPNKNVQNELKGQESNENASDVAQKPEEENKDNPKKDSNTQAENITKSTNVDNATKPKPDQYKVIGDCDKEIIHQSANLEEVLAYCKNLTPVDYSAIKEHKKETLFNYAETAINFDKYVNSRTTIEGSTWSCVDVYYKRIEDYFGVLTEQFKHYLHLSDNFELVNVLRNVDKQIGCKAKSESEMKVFYAVWWHKYKLVNFFNKLIITGEELTNQISINDKSIKCMQFTPQTIVKEQLYLVTRFALVEENENIRLPMCVVKKK